MEQLNYAGKSPVPLTGTTSTLTRRFPQTRQAETMLLCTRDVERRLFQEMAQDLALCARQKMSLRSLTRPLLQRVDVAVLALLVLTQERLRHIRRFLWERLRRVRADRLAQFAGLWTEWMAFMLVTHVVAQLVLRVLL